MGPAADLQAARPNLVAKRDKDPAEALRDVPPRKFVRARNALAARLAKNGKTAENRAGLPPTVHGLHDGGRLPLASTVARHGLAAAGEAGVARAIEILRTDLERTLRLLGCASIAALDHTYVNVSPRWLSQPEGGTAVHRIRPPGIRATESEIVDARGPKGE